MRYQHNVLLGSIAQPLPHPPGSFPNRHRIRRPEALFARPVRRQVRQIEVRKFGVALKLFSWAASVASRRRARESAKTEDHVAST